MKCNKPNSIGILLLVYVICIGSTICHAQQQFVLITGKISDTQNNPISGAKVSLINIPSLSTKTKTDGSFLLKHIPTHVINSKESNFRPTISFTTNGLILNQKKAGKVSIAIHNMRGMLVSSLFKGSLERGCHLFTTPNNIARSIYIVGITENNITYYSKTPTIQTIQTNRNLPIHGSQNPANTQNNVSKRTLIRNFFAIDTVVITKEAFAIKKLAIDTYTTTISTQMVSAGAMIPSYEPGFWNDNSTTKKKNNCYNYGNNKKTNTFAQPGRASGNKYKKCNCKEVYKAALSDGLDSCSSITQPLPPGKARVALAVVPTGKDYHWWREDIDKKWSHKPGKGRATNKDNSKKIITDPEKANRGRYKTFCGYLFVDSDSAQGEGHEKIRSGSHMPIKGSFEPKYELLSKTKVTIMINSGCEDPYYFLNDEKISSTIQSIIDNAQKHGTYSLESIEPSRLGYRGMLIQQYTHSVEYPDEYIIYKDYIECNPYNGKRKIHMFDSSLLLEKRLIDQALLKNVIDQELVDEEFDFQD